MILPSMRMVINESQIMEKGKHPDVKYFVAYTESRASSLLLVAPTVRRTPLESPLDLTSNMLLIYGAKTPTKKESGPNQKPLTIKPYPG